MTTTTKFAQYPRGARLEKPAKQAPTSCYRCGGAGGSTGWPGYTCFRCGGTGTDPTHRAWAYPAAWTDEQCQEWDERRQARLARAAERRAAKERVALDAQRDRNLERFPELRAVWQRWQQGGAAVTLADEDEPTHGLPAFAVDVLWKGWRHDLTEKQVAAVLRAVEQFDERQRADEAREQRIEQLPPLRGKQTVRGRVVKTDARDAPMGGTRYVMTVKLEDERIVWGTQPLVKGTDRDPAGDLLDTYPAKGDVVEFTATFEAGPDAGIAFFKRPRAARLIEEGGGGG